MYVCLIIIKVYEVSKAHYKMKPDSNYEIFRLASVEILSFYLLCVYSSAKDHG
jgi:hypothetical protein